MMKYLQKLGKSLMLPVAVLPAAAILSGLGYWLAPSAADTSAIAAFLKSSGGALIDSMGILFAVGIALGMSKDKDGAAAFSGLVAFLVVTTLLSVTSVAHLTGIDVSEVNVAFSKINNTNQFVGILSGCIAAAIYNRFNNTQLPTALAFFSGKRCVPIVTSFVMLIISGILFFVWPIIFGALVAFGTSISGLGPIGAGIYAFFNRLLIPTGLHHALNSVFWFDIAGINDIGNFLGATGVKGVTGMYQAGFFPIMMFGLPAAGFAMYKTAKPGKEAAALSLVMAAGFAAFFTGVTEPLEFAFMFAAPGLYLCHAALTGLSVAFAAAMHWTSGFGFSAGLTDFILSFRNPLANKPYMLIVQGIVFAVIYFVVFSLLIKKFDLKTPGREDDDIDESEKTLTLSNNNFTDVAKAIYTALGGAENVISIDNCVTRLRLEVKDSGAINEKAIKAAGAAGIIRPGKNSVQVIIGTKVQFVADEMKKL